MRTKKITLTGTIENTVEYFVNIKADDGDWYSFKSKLKYKEGDRVKFDVKDNLEAFDLALIGGPIPCFNVRHL